MAKYFLFAFLFFPTMVCFAEDKITDAPAVPAYSIGVEDVLDINVLQPEKMLITVAVAPDGSVNFPYIGSVKALGLSLDTLQENIQNSLAQGYMKYPVVSVTLRESRSRKVSVYGQVNRPGAFPVSDNKMTVLDAISLAGGFNVPGSSGSVNIIRPAAGKAPERIEVRIDSMMNSSKDVLIQPGDTLMVSQDKFFVYGEVQRPGPYPLDENTTVLKAIAMAGGFTKFGSTSRVKCLRPYGDKPGFQTIKLKVDAIMDGNNKEDLTLKTGDIIVVSEGVF